MVAQGEREREEEEKEKKKGGKNAQLDAATVSRGSRAAAAGEQLGKRVKSCCSGEDVGVFVWEKRERWPCDSSRPPTGPRVCVCVCVARRDKAAATQDQLSFSNGSSLQPALSALLSRVPALPHGQSQSPSSHTPAVVVGWGFKVRGFMGFCFVLFFLSLCVIF